MKPTYENARGAIQQATRPGREAAAFVRLRAAAGFTEEQAWALARGGYDVLFLPGTLVVLP